MFSKRYSIPKNDRTNERGIAMLLCLFALLLLTGLGLALMYMSDTEQAVNNNYRDAQSAYFAAQAGLQDARVWLMAKAATTPSAMPAAGANTGVTYLLNPKGGESVQPWSTTSTYFDTELCNESFSSAGVSATGWSVPCASVPSGTYYKTVNSGDPNRATSKAMDYKWVRITWKANQNSAPYYVSGTTASNTPVCWTGTKQMLMPAGFASCEAASDQLTTVYRLTSFAVAPAGTRRMLQMEVATNPPFMTNAAVDSQDHVTLNGQLDVNGYDYCNCNCTTTKSGGTSTTTCTDRAGKTCDRSKWAIYASSTVDTANKSETLVAGQSPAVAQNQPWIYDIPGLINSYKDGAVNVTKAPYNWSCTGTPSNCGTHSGLNYGIPPAFPPSPVDNPTYDSTFGSCSGGVGPGCPSPQVTYVPGDAKLTASSNGNGILIVDGDLEINGGLQFYGLVLVKGVIKFTGGGADKTNIYGAVLAGQESYVDNVLGGSAVINFNSCALKQNTGNKPPTMINFHEMSY
jgi:hypothetical protein